MLQKKIQALFHPERYHGWGKNKKYFEGWYYKILTADEKYAFAFIPGMAMDNEGNKQAFIQILDGKKQTARYIKFPAEDFISHSNTFKTEIAGNTFTRNKITLQLKSARGTLQFKDQVLWPNRWYSPGIMGPYAFVPFMECYHGILSMDHSIVGELEIDHKKIDFTGGRGYIEKDWGHSFPSAYLWMQSNHFSQKGISLKASVAKIPWLGSSFVGFIAGLYFNNELIQFTTYNKTKLIRSNANKKTVELVMENKKYRLEILASRNEATELAAPILGFMDGRISESMTAKLEVKLIAKKHNQILFQDTGRNAALEVAGKLDEITIGSF
jgi:tocopherol cyclase